MIAVLQRVNSATVEVEGQTIARINAGLLVLIGVQAEDDQAGMAQMLTRLLNYRVFADADDRMNLSLIDIAGGLLLVPQFTLAANTRKGGTTRARPTNFRGDGRTGPGAISQGRKRTLRRRYADCAGE